MAIHDFDPAAVPAPVPNSSVRTSRNTAMAYTKGVAHSSMRGDVRNIRNTMTAPRASQISWRCQIVATKVGTSV